MARRSSHSEYVCGTQVSRRHDPRRARSYRSYDAGQLRQLFGVGHTTVWRWQKLGLEPIPGSRPRLFAGSVVAEFIRALNSPRQPLAPGEIYCVACKVPVRPLDGIVRLLPRTVTSSDLVGTCPRCGRQVFRRVRLSELAIKAAGLTITPEDVNTPVRSRTDRPRVKRSRKFVK